MHRKVRLIFKTKKHFSRSAFFFGAATQIRTGDLILTKDVLYQLSHSSNTSRVFPLGYVIIAKRYSFVKSFFKKIKKGKKLSDRHRECGKLSATIIAVESAVGAREEFGADSLRIELKAKKNREKR